MNNLDRKSQIKSGQHADFVDQVSRKRQQIPLYSVVLVNDDYTPMFFVIDVLERFFYMDREKAFALMLTVHVQGKGLCGVFSLDVAQTKVMQVTMYAREHSHPLLCKIEKLNE